MTTLVDFISKFYYSNKVISWMISNGGNYPWGFAQSFKGNGLALDSCDFYLKRKETQTGYLCAKLYSYLMIDPPDYDGGGIPGGSLDGDGRVIALATSDYVDVSTISNTSFSTVTFTFSGANRHVLSDAGTDDHFFIAVEYVGNNSNNLGRGVYVGSYDALTNVKYLSLGGSVIVDMADAFYYYTGRLTNVLVIYSVYSESGTDPATSAPILATPSDVSTITDTYQPWFNWNDVTDATKYRLQVSSLNDFSNNYEDRTALTSDFTPIANLKGYNGVYYWRVAAANSESTWSSWSSTFSFTIAVPYVGRPVDPGDPNIEDSTEENGYLPFVFHNNTNITEKVISYTRTAEICTGIGTLELILVGDATVYEAWDKITLFENGRKKGIFYISSNEYSAKDGTRRIAAQDGSKLLSDYFIAESYTIDYESHTGYWIDKFLTDAKVTHNPVALGALLSPDTQLGLTSAYDIVQTLLQYNGWYMYFDPDNVCIIGDLTVGTKSSLTINDATIRNISTTKSDKMLRNRAVVWGNTDTTTGVQIIADMTMQTPWNYDSKDQRAVVVSNSSIYNQADANSIAKKVLKEFSRITYEKNIDIIGEVNTHLGATVKIKSRGYTGMGLVTTIGSSFGKEGLITSIILDQRCPRLFAYWGEEPDDYVYVGTSNNGVYRKELSGSTFEAFNDALPSGASVSDLYINNGILATIIGSGANSGELYYRDVDTSWQHFVPSGIMDEDNITVSGLYARGLTMNHQSNNIIAGYNNISEISSTNRAWVLQITASGDCLYRSQVYVGSGDYKCHIVDLDTTDIDNVVSVECSDIQAIPVAFSGYNFGYRTNNPRDLQDGSYTYLPTSSGIQLRYNVDYTLDGDYVSEWTENKSKMGSANIITQYEDIGKSYCYYIYPERVTADSVKSIARRVKINFDAANTVTEVDLAIDIEGFTIYKFPDNDDHIYAVGGSGVYDIDFLAGTKTLHTFVLTSPSTSHTTTYWRDVTILHVEVYGRYLYSVYREVAGDPRLDLYNVVYSYDVVDLLDGSTQIGMVIHPFVMAGFNVTHHRNISNCVHIKIEDEVPLVLESAFIGTIAYPCWSYVLYYGTQDESATEAMFMEALWSQDEDDPQADWVSYSYSGIGGQHALSGFVGHSNTNLTNIAISYCCRVYDNYGAGSPPTTVKILNGYIHLDDSLETTWTATEENYDSYDFPGMGYIDDTWLSCGSRYTQGPYFMDGNNTIRYGKTGGTKCTFTAADLGYTELQTSWVYGQTAVGGIGIGKATGSNTMDDVDDSIYILGKRGSPARWYTLGIDLDGKLVKEIQTAPDSPDGYTYDFAVRAFVSNSFLCTTKRQEDRNGHWTYSTSVHLFIPYYPDYIRGTGNKILKHRDDIFTKILDVDDLYKVEISKQTPIELYCVSGIAPIYQAATTSGEFSIITFPYKVTDGRIFDFTTASGIYLASGVLNEDDMRYFGMTTGPDSSLRAYPTSLLNPAIVIDVFSGITAHFETNNNTDTPYFFVSISGIPPRFYQRNSTGTSFTLYTSGLPVGSEITVIRMDDIL